MPPKKNATKAAAAAPADDGNGAFRWTVENERKLLVLTHGRYLSGEDYERLTTVFPGTTKKAITVRVSKLRVEQRDLYKELGWDLPEGGAKRKSGAGGGGDGGGGDTPTPTKKPRTPTKKGSAAKKDVEKGESEMDSEEGVNVKKEVVEDEMEGGEEEEVVV